MTTSHTPGPWQHKHLDFLQICDSDGVNRGCAPICRVAGGANGESRAEARANARLIVAAPELLEALIYAVDNPEFKSEAFDQMARAAIAKAGAGG